MQPRLSLFAFLLLLAPLAGATAQTPAPAAADKPTDLPLKARETQAVTPPSIISTEPAYKSDPKFEKAWEQARSGRQTPEERLDNYKHANKVSGGQCVPCMKQIVRLQMETGAYKDAVATSQQMESVATTAEDKQVAQLDRGLCLMRYNDGQPKPEPLAQAEAAFRAVLAARPNERTAVFSEGRALAMQGKNAEAKAMFEHFVDIAPASDKLRARAERFADDPHLATLQMAPPFRLVTNDGEQMQLDDMNGKVVLLDFWATWCEPCRETLPTIARLAKDYANDPMVVVISVSSDSDAAAWKAFIAKNNMTWPQYRDQTDSLGRAYGVQSIPHFFTIDTNGVLKTEQVGSGANVRGVVDDLVKKAHKAAAKQARETEKAAAGQ